MTRTLALIPARAGSKRVPGKNVRLFLGKPLIQWTLEFAQTYPGFDEVLVSTDCERVADVVRQCGVTLPWMRPAALATDQTGTLDVVMHALDACERQGRHFDRLALLQPTTPVRQFSRWDEAIRHLDDGAPAAIGVSPVEHHPYWTYWIGSDHSLQACFPGKTGLRSQVLPPAAAINGALYLIDVNTLRDQRSFVPEGVRAVVFDIDNVIETIDIDTEADWVAAEQIVSRAMGLK